MSINEGSNEAMPHRHISIPDDLADKLAALFELTDGTFEAYTESGWMFANNRDYINCNTFDEVLNYCRSIIVPTEININ